MSIKHSFTRQHDIVRERDSETGRKKERKRKSVCDPFVTNVLYRQNFNPALIIQEPLYCS